jgi:hypothetical protein
MPSTSQANEHQIISFEQWVWIFSSQAQEEEENGRCKNFRVVCLCRILLELNIAVAIQMHISMRGLLTREVIDHHFEIVSR